MVVLEKTAHPRHKLCAGGITTFGLKQLHRLNLFPDIPYVRIDEARFDFHRRSFSVHGRPVFIVTHRQEFDAWLAREAEGRGVTILEDHPVRRLERTSDGIIVDATHGQFLASVVVGADGARGMVRSWIGARGHVARLLEVVTGATGREAEYRRRCARFDFDPMRRDLQGYYWDFPSLIDNQPYMNSGVYDSRVDRGASHAQLPSLIEAGLGDRARLDAKLEGHPIHWFAPSNQLSERRVLLVGDAAGAEPLFGEGISIALAYGRIAAGAIDRAFKRQAFDFSDYRWRVLSSDVGRYLMVRWAGAQFLYHVRRIEPAVRLVWWLGMLFSRLTRPIAEHPKTKGTT
jgi:flavin-dependent dehydrogenase